MATSVSRRGHLGMKIVRSSCCFLVAITCTWAASSGKAEVVEWDGILDPQDRWVNAQKTGTRRSCPSPRTSRWEFTSKRSGLMPRAFTASLSLGLHILRSRAESELIDDQHDVPIYCGWGKVWWFRSDRSHEFDADYRRSHAAGCCLRSG